jgi:hypothetical protein
MSLINNLIDKLTEFLQVRVDKLKLDLLARLSKLFANLLSLFLIIIVGLFFSMFLSVALGAYINEIYESAYIGYLIVSGCYLVLLILIFILMKSGTIQKWMETIFISMSENLNNDEREN